MRHWLLPAGCVLTLLGQESPLPKPTAHHLALKDQVGTWNAVSRMVMVPGKPPVESRGTEVNTLVASGLWLRSELRAQLMGMAFEGHGLFGYDTQKQKHVGAWVDNSGTWMALTEGTCSQDCREQVLYFEGYDETGKQVRHKEIHLQLDSDHRRMEMYHPGKDGAWVKFMDLDYTRVK